MANGHVPAKTSATAESGNGGIGRDGLVFLAGMAMAGASFLLEQAIIGRIRRD